jgi:hypothetical protein
MACLPQGRVWVYFNVRTGDYSVRKQGRVVLHTENIALRDCEFRVWESGRQKVLKTGAKNVHAFVVGTIDESGRAPSCSRQTAVRYNPFETETFVEAGTNLPVFKADQVVLTKDGSRPLVLARF